MIARYYGDQQTAANMHGIRISYLTRVTSYKMERYSEIVLMVVFYIKTVALCINIMCACMYVCS